MVNEIEHFVPRKGLTKQIQSRLNESTDNTIVLSAMRGMGGVGKTTLANHLIHHTESSFKAWFNAESIDNLKGQYIDLAIAIHLYRLEDKSILEQSDKIEVISRIKQHLKDQPDWILVYDNVKKYEDIKALLPESGGHIIITSRHSKWPIGTTIDIDVMEEEEAVALVKNTTNTKEDEAIVKELVKKLGYLPLAISQACAYITASENMSVAEYLALYNQYAKELLDSEDRLPGDVHPPVAITWEMNFKEIIKKAAAAEGLLNACAFLDAADISEELLLNYFKKQGMDEFQYHEAKKALLEYCLIKVHEKSISLHRLVQTVLRHKMEQDVDTLNKVQKDLLDFFVESALKDYEKILSSDKETTERKAYLRQLFVQAQSFLPYLKEPKEKEGKEKYGYLLLYVGNCLEWHADYEKAKKQYEQALAIDRAIHGEANHPAIARSLNNLGFVFAKQGQYKEAQSHYEQALVILRAIHGGDKHLEVATSLNNLGIVFAKQGQHGKAQSHYEQALVILRAIHGGDKHPEVARSLNNLGGVLDAQGQYEQAQHYHEQALAIRRAIYGEDNHPAVAMSLNNLGLVFDKQGQYEQAQRCCEQALTIHRAIYGKDNHPDVATSLNNLGNVFTNQGQYEKAKNHYEQALAIRRAIHGGDNHPDVAISLNNLGAVFDKQGQYEQAQHYHEQALAIRRAVYGGDNHPAVAMSLHNLGTALDKQGQYEQAQSHHKQALAIYRAAHGGDKHPDVAGSLNELGDVFTNQGQYEKAQSHFEQALAVRRAIHGGDNHPAVAKSFNSLGTVFDKQGQYEKAKNHYEQALAIRRAVYGEDHPDTKQTQENIKNLEKRMKNRAPLGNILAPETDSSGTIVSVANNPNQFYSQQRDASISNANETKKFGNYLKVTKEIREQETVYEFNLIDLWQNLEEAQKRDLREAIKKLHSKNRGEMISDENIIKISFLKEGAQVLLEKLKEILSFDDNLLPGETSLPKLGI